MRLRKSTRSVLTEPFAILLNFVFCQNSLLLAFAVNTVPKIVLSTMWASHADHRLLRVAPTNFTHVMIFILFMCTKERLT